VQLCQAHSQVAPNVQKIFLEVFNVTPVSVAQDVCSVGQDFVPRAAPHGLLHAAQVGKELFFELGGWNELVPVLHVRLVKFGHVARDVF